MTIEGDNKLVENAEKMQQFELLEAERQKEEVVRQ